MPLLSWDGCSSPLKPFPFQSKAQSPVCTSLSLPPYMQHRRPILLPHCSSIASLLCSVPSLSPSPARSSHCCCLFSQTAPRHYLPTPHYISCPLQRDLPWPSSRSTPWPAVPFVGCIASTQLSNYCLAHPPPQNRIFSRAGH